MKKIIWSLFLATFIFSCASNNGNHLAQEELERIDTVRITHDSLEHEIVFVEQGFNFWLETEADPRNTYPQDYLEEMNFKMVETYNFRCKDELLYADIYSEPIMYNPRIDYGYEFHYLLYSYLTFFQEQYAQNL